MLVLVVEDEPILRVVAVEIVRGAGHDAIGVVDAAAALHVLGRRDDIHVVFSDIEMPPGIDGLELASTIRRRWPKIATVLTSGKRYPTESELGERSVFVPKPYGPPEVVAAIRQLAA